MKKVVVPDQIETIARNAVDAALAVHRALNLDFQTDIPDSAFANLRSS